MKPISGISCKHCGSYNTIKCFNNSNDAISCRDCKRKFVLEKKTYIRHGRKPGLSCGIQCKHCKSVNTIKIGKSWYNDVQRIKCRDCKKVSQTEYVYENQGIECPHCKSNHTIREAVYHSSYAFRCRNCDKYFNIKFEPLKKDIPKCPKCKSENTRLSKKGYRKCVDCSKEFKYSNKIYRNRFYDPKVKDKIIEMLKEGYGVRQTARVTQVSTKVVCDVNQMLKTNHLLKNI